MIDPDPAAALSLRERKKLRTRTELADSALALFNDKGFDETTLDELVESVELSKRTFFRYFQSKEQVALSAEVELWSAYKDNVKASTAEGNVIDVLRDILCDTVAAMPNGWDDRFFKTRGLAAHTPSLWARSLALSAHAERDIVETLAGHLGVGTSDMPLRMAAEIAFGAWRCGAKNWISDQKRRGRKKLADQLRAAFDAVPPSLRLSTPIG
ncbi:MAG: TetR/AcrR family transcriptional regulator [Stackebrandtia sp.]